MHKIIYILLSLLISMTVFSKVELGPIKTLFKIEEIDVTGIKKVEKEAILERINSKVGQNATNYSVRKDIEKIYSLKYFENVEAHQIKRGGKNILLFKVVEKPIVAAIQISGNDEIDEDDLTEVIKSKEFSILDVNTVKSDVKALHKHYEEKGYYLASVRYRLKKIDDENIELVFEVQEFDKVMVKKITFLGNKSFEDTQLKDIMETREESLFSFMSNSGNFKEFNFQNDIERIKYFYKTKGHLQVNVGTPEITVSEDKKWVFITVKVNEGPKFTVNSVSFQGEVLFDEDELREELLSKKDNTFSEADVRQDIQLLTEKYQDEGYAFANVLRTLRVVPGENKVDLEYSFEKGKIAYFGKFYIKGNTKTRDKVVRRELYIKEGKKFSGSDLRKSKENVNRLGFFEPGSVVFNTVSSKDRDDVLDVEITVKERNTGQISLGAGFSTAQGGFMNASIAQNNFRGLGQNLSFSLTLSGSEKSGNIGFTEPYLFDSKWTAGGDIFARSNNASDDASFLKRGFDVRVGYPIFEYTRLFFTYKLEETRITNVKDPKINEDLENGIASSIRTSVIRDERDNKFEPSKGHYLSYSVEFAGIGGDKKWLKNEADFRHYKRIYGDLVLRSRFYGGHLDRVDGFDIPRTEKFTLGGPRNLRGFGFQKVGPESNVVDPVTGKIETFNAGSQFAAFSQIELEHPLAREAGLKWVLFTDAGDAGSYDNFKLHVDYGFGFRWFSPIGVLRFEFGYPLRPKAKGAGSQFIFDIGQLF